MTIREQDLLHAAKEFMKSVDADGRGIFCGPPDMKAWREFCDAWETLKAKESR